MQTSSYISEAITLELIDMQNKSSQEGQAKDKETNAPPPP